MWYSPAEPERAHRRNVSVPVPKRVEQLSRIRCVIPTLGKLHPRNDR